VQLREERVKAFTKSRNELLARIAQKTAVAERKS